jgi:4,5-dihydroxyphthalate decarboxylase
MKLRIALDLYDRHMPFFLGTVPVPAGVAIEALEVGMVPPRRHGIRRHARMLTEAEFDVCEVSLASYIIARARGRPFTAVPVFPRRLFSQNHLFVRADSGITAPRQLAGRRVAVWAFQVTMSVLAKGDLASEYGLAWRDVQWVAEAQEEIPWTPPPGVKLALAPAGVTGAELLLRGEVDAYLNPHPPRSITESGGRVRRLFAHTAAECERYYATRGYYPIMHLLAVRRDLAEREPWLARELMRMWDDAKQIAAEYYADPGFSVLAFARNEFERQADALGHDLWPSGLRANHQNLADFIGYMKDQALIEQTPAPEELFHESVRDT